MNNKVSTWFKTVIDTEVTVVEVDKSYECKGMIKQNRKLETGEEQVRELSLKVTDTNEMNVLVKVLESLYSFGADPEYGWELLQ